MLSKLVESAKIVYSSTILDISLATLLVLSFIINCCVIGKPLRTTKKKQPEQSRQKIKYGIVGNVKETDWILLTLSQFSFGLCIDWFNS